MKIDRLTRLTVIFSMIPAVYLAYFPGKVVYITVLTSFPLIFILLKYLNENKINVDYKSTLVFFNFYGLIVLFRGLLAAKTFKYWGTLLSDNIPLYLFIQFTIYLSCVNKSLHSMLKSFVLFVLPMSLLIYFRKQDSLGFSDFAHCLTPIYLFIIFLPYLNFKSKILVIFLAFFSFFTDISDRANMINIIISLLITSSYYIRRSVIALRLMKFGRMFFFTAPIFFLVFALLGIFNIFKIGDIYGDYSIEDKSGKSQEILVDSRTPIYTDVFSELVTRDAVLFGLGADGTTPTSLTDLTYDDVSFDKVYSEGRPGTESGMLNFIQWSGLFGAFLYFLLLFKSSYAGMYKSNNWLCVMLGLWVAYKAMFSFVEDTLFFSIYSIFILVPIGMCLNKELKGMNEKDISLFFKDIVI